jgi:hypothetical protein
MAQEQRQWPQAEEYYLKALATFLEYRDEHRGDFIWHNLTLLWRDSSDPELPKAVAVVLGESPEETENRMRETLARLQEDEPSPQPQPE